MDTERMMTAHTTELSAGIGGNRVRVKVRVGREGVHLLATLDVSEYLPPDDGNPMWRVVEGLYTESAELTWGEVERAGREPDAVVAGRSRELGLVLVRRALPLKPPGVVYCDGTD